MSVTLTLQGVGALRQRLRRVAERLGQRARLHRRGGEAVAGWVRRNFDAEGRLAADGAESWPPLARGTLAARRRKGQGSRPLQATGRLRAGTRLASSAAEAVVENPVPYAARHQLGLGVPARPFFPTHAQARRILDPVVDAFVREALR